MTMPTLYIPHGGGPWPWMPERAASLMPLLHYLEGLGAHLPTVPKGILCVTAHWEAAVPTVSSHPQPGMLYDYYNFPPETYQLKWPAPGDPGLAQRVRSLLGAADITSAADPERGYDHGTFVPLAVAWPSPTIPTVQLSLVQTLDPATHLAMGRALAPLREEGILILGSGMSYHNMRGFQSAQGRKDSLLFDAWLSQAVQDVEGRAEALCRWSQAPAARACHPREEHLLPLMVVTGAAGADPAKLPFQHDVMGVQVSAVHYG